MKQLYRPQQHVINQSHISLKIQIQKAENKRLTLAERELERRPPIAAGIELGPIEKSAGVMN